MTIWTLAERWPIRVVAGAGFRRQSHTNLRDCASRLDPDPAGTAWHELHLSSLRASLCLRLVSTVLGCFNGFSSRSGL